MYREIRVTAGHDLDSPQRYKPDVTYMVLYKPYRRYAKNRKGYQCIRLFVNNKAMQTIDRMDAIGEIQVLYCTPVQNGEICDLDYHDRLSNSTKEKANGAGNEVKE